EPVKIPRLFPARGTVKENPHHMLARGERDILLVDRPPGRRFPAPGNTDFPRHIAAIHFNMERGAAAHWLESPLESVEAGSSHIHRIFQPLPSPNRADVIPAAIIGRREQFDRRPAIDASLAVAGIVERNALAAVVKILRLDCRSDIK